MSTAIDLFAGAGGFSLGAEMAGVDVLWAANHHRPAIDMHAHNHPHTAHSCQDLQQANFFDVPDHDILLTAPACQGYSQASQPKRRKYHDVLRSTAWAVVSCAEAKMPDVILTENVPDFLRWRLYPAWRRALETLGYSLAEIVLTATNHGVPQRRKRLFVVATRSANPIDLHFPEVPEPAFGPCIDWEAGKWRAVANASVKVQERISAGRSRHGDRFVTQHVTNHPGIPLDQAVRTLTRQDQFAVVNGDVYRPFTIDEYKRGMGFPMAWVVPEDMNRREIVNAMGNAVCPPVARDLLMAIQEAA